MRHDGNFDVGAQRDSMRRFNTASIAAFAEIQTEH
jgi:hypothetical protein